MGRLIAIFGNGDLGRAASLAGEADLVIRFNDARSAGVDAKRTDIIAVCNTGRPAKAMVESVVWRQSEAVCAAREIVCVRAPERYARMSAELADSHPELDDYCDDYTAAFEAFAHQSGKSFCALSSALHEKLEEELVELGAGAFVSPSTGILLMADVLENRSAPGDEILLSGFSHEGWELHPWEAERRWVDARVSEGRLMRAEEFYDNHTYQEFRTHAL